ncbi:MAG: tetratricopeptide repeat protein [Deltaproteobacteria bacterium]|nr:tetratricopeptide repeat protein [Deltaproteobacteria bacterium]
MAKKKRVTRKQLLKEPDEFITFTGKLIRFGRRYHKELTYATCAFFIIVIALVAFRYFSNRAEDTASDLLRQAMQKYETRRNDTDADKAFAEVGPDFEYILEKYSNKHAGKMAGVIYANLSYEAGNTDTAILLYEKALDDNPADGGYRNLILSSLGYAYEQKRDLKTALTYFEEITDSSNPVAKDVALFNIGRLYEEIGEPAKSRKAFNRLISEFQNSIYYDLVNEKIAG